MIYHVFYLPKKPKNKEQLIKAIAYVYNVDERQINYLLSNNKSLIFYELEELSTSNHFNYELTIHVPKKIALTSQVYNILSAGLIFQNLLKSELLIEDNSDDPYQSILIKKGKIFLVEEDGINESYGINLFLESEQQQLCILKSLKLFPDKEYIENNDINIINSRIIDSKRWKGAIK